VEEDAATPIREKGGRMRTFIEKKKEQHEKKRVETGQTAIDL